jgi:hypothetical protein
LLFCFSLLFCLSSFFAYLFFCFSASHKPMVIFLTNSR